MFRAALNQLIYFPERTLPAAPERMGLRHRELAPRTGDGEQLHGWWIESRSATIGHLLLCHGNAGNIADRLLHAALLSAAGFDVLLFDYRGYGASTGTPSEEGTYRDARAALRCLLEQPEVDPRRVVYLGESLGGAIALELALFSPPAGLVLLSTFTSVRALARVHYPFFPAGVVPDAYPSLQRIPRLAAPLLLLHGDQDEIVPIAHAHELFEAAPEPKALHMFAGVGHNDLVSDAGRELAEVIVAWAREHLPAA